MKITAYSWGVSEMGVAGSKDANVTANWYASTLGVFADEGVSVFTPWRWQPGMWEVLHLFSRYGRPFRVASQSTSDSLVSAYVSVNPTADSMTVILVNRTVDQSQSVRVALTNFDIPDNIYEVLVLQDLPADKETFVSHKKNALKKMLIQVKNGGVTLQMAPLSVYAILLPGTGVAEPLFRKTAASSLVVNTELDESGNSVRVVYHLPIASDVTIELLDIQHRFSQ